jgi:hypothetical protein
VTLHPNRFSLSVLFAFLAAAMPCFARDSDPVRIPLTFETNQGQAAPEVRFLARSGGRTVFLTDDAVVLTSHTGGIARHVTMRLLDAESVEPRGESKTGGFANYYRTQDKANWQSNIPLFGAVRYAGVYNGIDALFRASKDEMEFDFEIQPGTSPTKVQLDFDGADRVSIAADGGLDVVSGSETWHLVAPVAYQTVGNRRVAVAAEYQVAPEGTVSFQVGEYDRSLKLTIDPVVQYASAISTNNETDVVAIATDAAGDLFIAGQTLASDYPVVNGLGPIGNSVTQVYVTKINPAGTAILYSTYLPTSSFSSAQNLVVDVNGNAYVTGTAGSSDFPVTSTNLGTCTQFCNTGFVTKLSPSGAIVYSTLLASGQVGAQALAVDASGNAYVAGSTADSTLQTVNAFQTTQGTAFFAKLNATGTAYVFSSYFGGTMGQGPIRGIALDGSGNIYIAGITGQDPPLVKPWQSGNGNLFLAKFASDGKTLLFSTRLGSSEDPNIVPPQQALTGMAVGGDGTVYLVGAQAGPDFPYTLNAALHPVIASGAISNMYAMAIDPTLSKLTYSTYLGDGFANGFALDSANHLHIAGSASGNMTPPIRTPMEAEPIGPGDGFFMELDATGIFVTVSKFGGETAPQIPASVAIDTANNVYLAGSFALSNSTFENILLGQGLGFPVPSTYASFVAKLVSGSGPQVVLSTSQSIVALRNLGSADLHISSITLGGNLTKQVTNCPNVVPAGSLCFITPTDANGKAATGTVTVNSDAQPGAQSIALTPSSPGATIGDLIYSETATILFPPQQQNTSTEPYPLKLWNIGATPATINSVVVGGPAAQTNDCGVIQPGGGCTINLTVTPPNNGGGANLNVTYDGNGFFSLTNIFGAVSAQQILLSTTAIEFARQQVGGVAIARTVTVTNTGNAAVSAAPVALTGDPEYTITGNTCTAALAPHQSCAVGVQFVPQINGTRTGTLDIAGQPVTLDGQGQIGSTVQVSPLELGAPGIPVGSSFPITLTLTNTLATAATITGVSISLADYTEQDSCQGQIPANGTCVMTITFAPSTVGPRNGQMTITFGGGVVAQVLPLSGSGVTPLTVDETSLDFGGATVVGSTSAVQFVEVGNGGGSLIPYAVSISGDFNAVNTCGIPFPKFTGCPVNVTFQPKKVGTQTGQLVISYPGISVQNVVTLTGTAQPQFTAGPASGGSLSATVKSGATATYSLILKGAPGFTGPVQVTCSGAPKFAVCTAQPTSVTIPASGSATVTISVTTSTSTTARLLDSTRPLVWALLLLPALFGIRRRARMSVLAMCLALAGISCGGGGGSTSGGGTNPPPPPTASTTPAGTYMLQASMAGGATTQSVPLTLIVQ